PVAPSTGATVELKAVPGGPYLGSLGCPPPLTPSLTAWLWLNVQGGSAEVREGAAEGLGELVVCASEEALRPHVVQITGPLIRIIGDRFPSSVKSAILGTLGGLIAKAGTGLKPFVPQLQTTFLKCLADPADAVRQRAARNLGELVRLSPRADQLAGELATSARSAEPEVRDAYLLALRGLLLSSGERLSPAVMEALGQQLRDMARLAVDNDEFRYSLASCLGAHTRHASMDQVRTTLSWGPLAPPAAAAAQSASDKQLHACVLSTVAPHCGGRLAAEPALTAAVMDAVTRYARDPDPALRVAAGRAASRMAVAVPSLLTPACQVLGALLGPDQSTEVARQALLSTMAPLHIAPHAGPVKVTCELSLQKVLQLEAGLDVAQRYLATGPGTTVRTTLTDAFLRRAAKLSGDDELFSNEEY
ncbi:armadillo-type protein, partial [Haematococcus lacustris]